MFASSSSCPVAPRLLPKSAPSRGRRAASAPSYRQVEAAERRLVGSVSAPQPSGSSSSAASVVPASSPSSAGSSSQRQPGPSSPVASPIGRSSFAPIGQPPHCSTSRYWALSSPAGLDLSDRRAFSSAPPSRSSSCPRSSNPFRRLPSTWRTAAGQPPLPSALRPLPSLSRNLATSRPSLDDAAADRPPIRPSPEDPPLDVQQHADRPVPHATPAPVLAPLDDGAALAGSLFSSGAALAESLEDTTVRYPDESFNRILQAHRGRLSRGDNSSEPATPTSEAGPPAEAAASGEAPAPASPPTFHTSSEPSPSRPSLFFPASPAKVAISSPLAPPPLEGRTLPAVPKRWTPPPPKTSSRSVPASDGPRPPPPLNVPATDELVRAEAERLLQRTILPRLRKQYEADVARLTATIGNDLLRDVHAQAAGRARAALVPCLSPDQDPPEVLLSLVRAVSGPKDLANALAVLRQAKRKGWQLHPDTAVAVAECFPPVDAIRILRDGQVYGVAIPPLARLKVLRTLLRNLFSRENPLGLEAPPVTHEDLGYFRMLARNQHLEDPFMVALMLNALVKLKVPDFEARISASSGTSLTVLSERWAKCPLSVDEGHATMVLLDTIRDRSEATALFDTLPLLHVHRHRERLLALLQRTLPAEAAVKEKRKVAETYLLPWASSLASRRSEAAAEQQKSDGEVLTVSKLRRWLRPALSSHPHDPVILMLALQLAARLTTPTSAAAETALILERVDELEPESAAWRLVHDDEAHPGQARTLARRTIELGLAQRAKELGDRAPLWERLLQ